jgi:hypothetical protein
LQGTKIVLFFPQRKGTEIVLRGDNSGFSDPGANVKRAYFAAGSAAHIYMHQ